MIDTADATAMAGTSQRIAPGDTVDVTLRWGEPRTHAEFEITREGVRCSAGRVALRHAPEAAP